jgi:signal transduction histidine kinase
MSLRQAQSWRRGRFFGGPHGSLYGRLLLLSFLTLASLWALAAGVFRLAQGERTRPEVDRFVRHYVDYLAADLGQPPSADKGVALASKTGWNFRWEPALGVGWATSPDLPYSLELRSQTRHPGGDSGWRHGRFFFLLRQPQGTVVFLAQAWTPPQFNKAWLLLLGFGACAILGFSFLAARSMLRPLRQLDQALASFAEGDLTARLPHTLRHDELGRLTFRFNQMATEVGRMLDSRRQLLLDVSHELRTPLTRLNLGLELMKDDAARAPLKEDVAEMEAMLAELLEGARIEQAARWQPQAVDLAGLLKEAAQDTAGRSPGLALELPAEPLVVLGDERGLRVLVRNLCDNALKYSGEQSQKVEAKLWQADGRACLQIRDHGPGIAEGALPHLFEPFYRADASRNRGTGGFGLGLHLVQKVALAHGGEVQAANAPGGGALFTVFLPLIKPTSLA